MIKVGWNIENFYKLDLKADLIYGLIILNRPISHYADHLVNLWKNARVTLTADGGTDRWESFLSTLDDGIRHSLKIPDLVTGDFDSIQNDTMEKYRNMGSKILHTPNQNATDFTKAIIEMISHCAKDSVSLDTILVISESSGRLDHIMANVNTLFLCHKRDAMPACPPVYLMSDSSLSWLLVRGEHEITIPRELRERKSWCALIPIGQPCSQVTTTGLKWNLDSQSLEFGGLVSTSNSYDGSSLVTVKCSHSLLWSMETTALVCNS